MGCLVGEKPEDEHLRRQSAHRPDRPGGEDHRKQGRSLHYKKLGRKRQSFKSKILKKP